MVNRLPFAFVLAASLSALGVHIWTSADAQSGYVAPPVGPVSVTGTGDPTDAVPVAFGAANQSAFGDLVSVGMTPTFQADFVYGVNTQLGAGSVVTTGVVDSVISRGLRVQSGVGAAGSGRYDSRRPASYRPGQGVIARFTGTFTACTANSEQLVGMANNATDGLGIGCNGATFGILHRNAGVSTWTAQSAWNGDKVNGSGASGMTIVPTNGNVYQVIYPYLGFGNITFWVQDQTTSRWNLLHTIRYTNANTLTELANPSLHFVAYSANTGNTTNVITYVGSVGTFITGVREFVVPKWASNHNKTGVSTTETAILNLRNATTMNGVPNHQTLRLRSMSIGYANSNSSIATIKLTVGATIGGSPSYTPISGATANSGVTITSGQSSASFDVAGTTVASGTVVHNAVATNATSYLVDMTPFDIFVGPGETLTASATATNSGQVGIGLTWDEAN